MINKLRFIFSQIKSKLESPKSAALRLGVEFGEGTVITSKNFGSEPYLIKLGKRVHVTHGVTFVTHDGGVWIDRDSNTKIDVFGKIEIGDHTYIGNHALILPGIKIGERCVIGAYSVVTKSIPDNCVVAGNPARFIKKSTDYLSDLKKFDVQTHGLSREQKRDILLKTKMGFVKKPQISLKK